MDIEKAPNNPIAHAIIYIYIYINIYNYIYRKYTTLPEFNFPSTFQIFSKIGSYRLPTHRRDAHRIFYLDSFRI